MASQTAATWAPETPVAEPRLAEYQGPATGCNVSAHRNTSPVDIQTIATRGRISDNQETKGIPAPLEYAGGETRIGQKSGLKKTPSFLRAGKKPERGGQRSVWFVATRGGGRQDPSKAVKQPANTRAA